MGLNRILGRGDNNLGITKGMRNFPYYEFYETFREFGIPHEDLVEDVEKWTRELFNTVRCSRDYIERNNALHELEGLYKVSRSEVVEDALRKLFQDEVYEYMESIDERSLRNPWPAILLTAGTLGSFFYLFYNN